MPGLWCVEMGFPVEVRSLVEDELRRLDLVDDEPRLWEAAYRRVRDGVRLLVSDGRPVPEFLLRTQGESAWWRWSDESFPDSESET
jgi:hypothetical protein